MRRMETKQQKIVGALNTGTLSHVRQTNTHKTRTHRWSEGIYKYGGIKTMTEIRGGNERERTGREKMEENTKNKQSMFF